MVSLRGSVVNPNERISVKEIAEKYQLPAPISLRNLIAPDGLVTNSGVLDTGYVDGWMEIMVLSNGFWSCKGSIGDHSTFIGDSYIFTGYTNYRDESGTAAYFVQNGRLGTGDGKTWHEEGISPWIYSNWENIKAQGLHYHLHSEAHASYKDLYDIFCATTLGALVVTATVLGILGRCDWDKDENGNMIYHCEW